MSSRMGSEQGGAEGEREQLRGLITLEPPLAEPTGQSAGRGLDGPGVRVDLSTDIEHLSWTRKNTIELPRWLSGDPWVRKIPWRS